MGSDWDDHAATWDDNEGARAYANAAFMSLTQVLEEHGFDLTGLRILDFGCGTGLLTERLVGEASDVAAVDTSTAMLDVLSSKVESNEWSNVQVAASLDAIDGPFDLVVCSSVCAFVPDYPATARALAALLRSGGVFVQWDWELDESEDEPFGLTRAQIADALTAADLTSVSVDVGFRLPVEGMVMAPLMGTARAA